MAGAYAIRTSRSGRGLLCTWQVWPNGVAGTWPAFNKVSNMANSNTKAAPAATTKAAPAAAAPVTLYGYGPRAAKYTGNQGTKHGNGTAATWQAVQALLAANPKGVTMQALT